MDKKWFAIYVLSRNEKKVASLLTNQNIENYLPLQKSLKQWSDRKKIVEEPLFKSYVFAHITEDEKLKVRETKGVLNFVYWLGQPAIIRDQEIETIKHFLGNFENIVVQDFTPEINSSVKIQSGPMINQIGKIIKIGKNKVKIIIESLGFSLVADVPINKVLPLPAKK